MKKILLILICLLLSACNKDIETVDESKINELDYSCIQELDFDIHCKEYLIADLSEFKVLYGKDYNTKIYPASLTKLMTLDTVLNTVSDLSQTSYVDYYQVQDLIAQDASLAYIKVNYDYTIEDLLYALILPSGADAAVAIENYYTNNGLDIMNEMSSQIYRLGLENTNFVNTTGLHDDNHYTTINDLMKILMDILSFDEGRKILETTEYLLPNDLVMHSTLRYVAETDSSVYGGKTGYTDVAGQSIMMLYEKNNHSYVMILANAMDERPNREYWHFMDALEILDKLY